jgi:hypothetical protein
MCMMLDDLWWSLWYWRTLEPHIQRSIQERLLSEGRWFMSLRREREFRALMESMGCPDLEYQERMRDAEQRCKAVRAKSKAGNKT